MEIKNVAVLYSGGKDSNYAVEYCMNKGYNIRYLLTVKPSRKDCYLFHYATTEHAKLQADILGLKHILINCDVADPAKEAELVKEVVKENKVDAVILGGVGLQITQLESVQKVLLPLNVEVFASHAGDDHGKLFNDMIERGYEIMITQVAGDGLVKWLGKTITKDNFNELEKDSIKYGFHLGGEGGYYDSYVLDAPFFNERVNFNGVKKTVDGECTGHLEVYDAIKQLKVKL